MRRTLLLLLVCLSVNILLTEGYVFHSILMKSPDMWSVSNGNSAQTLRAGLKSKDFEKDTPVNLRRRIRMRAEDDVRQKEEKTNLRNEVIVPRQCFLNYWSHLCRWIKRIHF